ncbi:hypothetical protein KKHLCK_02285 [Candidatus Electrothrix laxa]
MPAHRQQGKRPCAGRADLLYFLQQTDRETLAATAPLFGYHAPEEQEQKLKEQAAVRSNPVLLPPQKEQQPKAQESRNQQRFFRLKQRSQIQENKPVTHPPQRLLDTPPFTSSIAQTKEEKARPVPVPQPLSPWRRIWPFLRAVLGAQDQSRQLDLDRIVRSLARGEVLHRLPYLSRASWAMRAQVLVDLDPQIHFFWHDFYDLVERLQGMRGRMGLDLLCFEDGPLEPCTAFDPERRNRQVPYRPPDPGTPILILSDLGLLNKREQGWLILGRRLQRAGLRPVVLMPCPERYWHGELAELFQLVVWDIGRRYPQRCDGLKKQGFLPRAEAQDPGLEDLLTASAAAVRVEPGLLREQRLLFPAGRMDVGTEAAVWQHQEVEADLLSFRLKPEAKEKYAQLFIAKRNTEDAAIYQQALGLMRAFHHVLPPEIGFEEELQRALLMDESPDKEALSFMWRVASTLHKRSEYPYLPHLKAWVYRLAQRQQQEYWSWEEGEPMSIALAQVLLEHYGPDEDIEFPTGFQLNRVAWLLDPGEPKEYELRQEMEQGLRQLVLYPVASIAEQRPGSMFMARLRMINNRLAWRHLRPDGQASPVHFLDIGRDREIPVPEEGALEIRGNFDQLLIDGMTKPDWASIAQGRQPGGKEYFHLVTQGEEKKELAWCDPGEYPVQNREGKQVATFWLTKGFFAVTDEIEEIQTQGFRQPSWAEHIGEDQYGLYADLFFKGVIQRFRWIQPGRFMMGSPKDEPERDDDEKMHQLVLTESYWLADTACTQEFWQAVTGKNPSWFIGKQRPVERVSWNDVQKLTKQINKAVFSLKLDLPSEAQWEYACRAGTNTPFSFGSTVSTDQVNFDGNDSYAGDKKGLYRRETVDVQDLPCNQWGLYQMHGNVWEWCRDRYRDFPDGGATLDLDSTATGRNRVCRGGSWDDRAAHCRSAYRNGDKPFFLDNWLGFRLSCRRIKG